MENNDRTYILIFLAIGLGAVALFTAWRAQSVTAKTCFASSKTYEIRFPSTGAVTRQSWAVEGDLFGQCVRRAEIADASLHQRYPDGRYDLTLASTIGCHFPCGG